MYYKLTNISGKNPYFHGEIRRRRIKVGRVIQTVRNGQSIVIDEENLRKYRFQNEIARDPDPETWTKYHILLAEPIIPEGKKKGKKTSKPGSKSKKEKEEISQTPESKTPGGPIDTEEPQTEIEKSRDSVDTSQKDESPKTSEEVTEEIEKTQELEEPKVEEVKEAEEPKVEEAEKTEEPEVEKTEETKEPEATEEAEEPEVEKTEEIKDESSDDPTAEVKEPSAEPEETPQSDDSTPKVTYTVDQLMKKGRGGIHKIKIAEGIKIPGYNSMGVKQRAEFIAKWFEENR